MVITQSRSKRKPSGARYVKFQNKRSYESGNAPTLSKVGPKKINVSRGLGGNTKIRIAQNDVANVLNSKTNKYAKAKIESVVENPANRHYVRRNVMTKGTIIQTDKGKAKITSKPGQEGTINAVLIE